MTCLDGAMPALVTPLTADGQVHEDDLARLVARALDDGASGVLVAGSTGEGALLGPTRRERSTRRARASIDARPDRGEVTLIAGACGATVADLDADVARLTAAGADVVLVLPPTTYPLRVEELVDLHLGVAERAEVPTLAYHIPRYSGSALTPEAVGELAGHPGIVGMKDSSDDADRRAAFVAAARAVDRDFSVLSGHVPSLSSALAAGVAGSVTAIANVRQRQVVALHDAVAAGDEPAVTRAQAALDRTWDALGAVGTSMPAALKAALQLDGTIEERWCRPPLHSVPGNRLDRVRTALMR